MQIQTTRSDRNVPIGSDKLSRNAKTPGLAAAFHFCFNSIQE